MKVQILTHFDEKFRPVADLTLPVLKEYCERHGYALRAQTERNSDRHPVWDKIKLFRDKLHLADWTVYMDSDALITNLKLPLDDLTSVDKDMVIAHDVNGLNSGVFMMRNTDWSEEFLQKVWHIDPAHPIYHRGGNNWYQTEAEQNAMKAVIADTKNADSKIHYVNQKRFNAYLYHLYNYPANQDGHWAKGDFVLHLPGMNNEQRVDILTQKLIQIVR